MPDGHEGRLFPPEHFLNLMQLLNDLKHYGNIFLRKLVGIMGR